MIKRFFFLSFMASAIGVPYLLSSSSDLWNSVKGKFSSTGSAATATPANPNTGSTAASPTKGGFGDSALSDFQQSPARAKNIEGAHTQNLVDVLNFNSTPERVTARWPRVTTGLAHPELQGYRVPLVTGTATDDLAGSLTYYFGANRTVEFITFHGVTGDPRKLIAHVVQQHGFQPQRTDDPGLAVYMIKWNGKPVSELRIQTARVLRADQPNLSYKVDLAMKRP
ncbi:MAG: DUF6690 family protein [Pirellulales bacterium]